MANRRDGGLVIVGIRDDGTKLTPIGLDSAQLETWRYDHVADSVAAYADPYIDFDIEICRLDGLDMVVITVEEFAEIPVICKRSFADKLAEGACYVRSRRKPETVSVASHTDMRELLELATSKSVRKFVARAHDAGLLGGAPPPQSDDTLFRSELGDLA